MVAEICDQLGFPLISSGTSEEVFFVFYGVIARWGLYGVFVIIAVDQMTTQEPSVYVFC